MKNVRNFPMNFMTSRSKKDAAASIHKTTFMQHIVKLPRKAFVSKVQGREKSSYLLMAAIVSNSPPEKPFACFQNKELLGNLTQLNK